MSRTKDRMPMKDHRIADVVSGPHEGRAGPSDRCALVDRRVAGARVTICPSCGAASPPETSSARSVGRRSLRKSKAHGPRWRPGKMSNRESLRERGRARAHHRAGRRRGCARPDRRVVGRCFRVRRDDGRGCRFGAVRRIQRYVASPAMETADDVGSPLKVGDAFGDRIASTSCSVLGAWERSTRPGTKCSTFR